MRLILRLIHFLLPSSLVARMALILLSGLLTAQAASFWLHWGERTSVVSEARGLHLADRIADAVRVLEADASPGHAKALAQLQSEELRVQLLPPDQVAVGAPRGQIQAAIAARLGSPRELRSPGMMNGVGQGGGMGMRQRDGAMRRFDLRLRDGQWVRIVAAREAPAPALPTDFYVHLLLSLLVVAAVAMFAVRLATRPLQQLAQAADVLGRDLAAPPLAETGASEVRHAAQAFNRMQGRIRHLIDERARALAAVSHDLRTPLTRLRLRAELVENSSLREQMTADLDVMAAMLNATLDYLRGLQESEPVRLIDINALLQSLVEDALVLGKPVSIEGAAQAPYPGRLTALRRALQNLIDNAIKYGRCAKIRVVESDELLQLSIEDEGPGIAPENMSRVTEPYFRQDASRRSATGGVGLGLSIVKDAAVLHGGELRLANREPVGLSATLVLPRNPG